MKKRDVIVVIVIIAAILLAFLAYNNSLFGGRELKIGEGLGNLIFINEKRVLPEEINITEGEEVTWINNRSNGRFGLAIIKGAGGFVMDSGELLPGERFTYLFNRSGEYRWIDVVRQYPGTVNVR